MQPFPRDRLAPRTVDRVRHVLRPGWARSVLVRRTASVMLVFVAVAVTVAGHRSEQSRAIVVAAHDLMPGRAVVATDLAIREIPGGLIPAGALRLTADGVGRTVAGRVRAGEVITDTRLLSARLPAQLTGRPDARLVPVRLSDETVTSLLREGDVVDVLTAGDEQPGSTSVLARGAVVALSSVSPDNGVLASGRSGARPVLLAMAESAAHRVAAAGLDASLAVVVH
ncbi:SAF domain-containing protein [Gordonia insulae]|uniref:SAF domain-containing protein n=1 Tax=Gordonia insulae TaxID=2420509 RepID=A0A3G8JJE7_9ACTN|nr:SAF domain-containing protein [Gordonia insulae]AZG45211.1 hypothetical protein D7316_01806 [Gordonia insulae]